MLKRILFLLALTCLTANAADTVPSEASVKEMLVITQVNKLLDSMLPQIDSMMQNGIREAMKGQQVSAEMQAKLDKSRTDAMSAMKEELAWSKLEPIYVRVYQKSFTQEEVSGMVAFYKTPIGQAMISKMPVVLQNTMAEVQTVMAPMMQRLQRSQQETVAQIQSEASKPKK